VASCWIFLYEWLKIIAVSLSLSKRYLKTSHYHCLPHLL